MSPSEAALGAFAGYGVELEYMIVDAGSLAVMPAADRLLDALSSADAAPPRAGFAWSNELVLHLLEVKNERPTPTLDRLAEGFQAEIARANAALAPLGARLMPGGMHPWMDPAAETRLWPHRDAAIYRAYDRIFDCRAHGWANIQSAQLNLPFADDEEFARLHSAVRVLLPILPALAASSPVADGRLRTELDFRMESYRRHAARRPALIGRVIPDAAISEARYRAEVLAPMYEAVARDDPEGALRDDWLNARGAIPRFGRRAIEIRVVDMQECPQADLAIAALTAAVARALYDGRWSSFAAQQGLATAALAGLLSDCTRAAEAAIIDDGGYLALFGFPRARCRAEELWAWLFAQCGSEAPLTDSHRAALQTVLGRGPLARRILHALGGHCERERLAAVYGELCECLAAGRLFLGLP
ncbi:MAG: glutamate-cysteine ligase family protein [Ignavibacteria bacterium]